VSNSYQNRYCGICDHALSREYFSLSRCNQTFTKTQSETLIVVSDAESLTDFCSQPCADQAETAITSTLSAPYPPSDETVPCSLCLHPVDRTLPHVSIAMTAFEDISQPWLLSARVTDERELAVYCAGCAGTLAASEAPIEDEQTATSRALDR
jgi:hypothetical protein